jgi:hypothetical protein
MHEQNENKVFGGIKNFSNGEEISNNTIIFDDPEFTSNSSSYDDIMQEISSSSSQHRYKLKSQPSFLSQSLHGSRRHLQKLAKNALAIVTELGKPTLFLTVTCNPKWPDITSRLLEGQTAFDRPDITVPLFHAKLSALINNLKYIKSILEKN